MQIEYILGQEMTLADTLSRLPSTENTDTIDLDIRVDLVRLRSQRLNEIKKKPKRKKQNKRNLINYKES